MTARTNPWLPTDSAERKKLPVATGVVDYFPLAVLAIAELSRKGNDQHNPGEPLHWAREKSTDQPDCLMRHFIERGKVDTDGVRHSTKVAWRALAILQLELEAERAPWVDRAASLFLNETNAKQSYLTDEKPKKTRRYATEMGPEQQYIDHDEGCRVCGYDCAGANPQPAYCPVRDGEGGL